MRDYETIKTTIYKRTQTSSSKAAKVPACRLWNTVAKMHWDPESTNALKLKYMQL